MRIKTVLVGTLVAAMLAGVLAAGVLAFASSSGYVCAGTDNDLEVWGIRKGREDKEYTNYIAPYVNRQLKVWVQPDSNLDVAVGLFVCIENRKPDPCRDLVIKNDRGRGGREEFTYDVKANNFYPEELTAGVWIIGVYAVEGCGEYQIEVNTYPPFKGYLPKATY